MITLKMLCGIFILTISTADNFFFQEEDGIRDADVTGVQTCALPILILMCCLSLTICSNKSENRTSKKSKTMIFDNPNDKSEAVNLAKQLERKGISDKLVLEAIASVPRHEFVDEKLRDYAYLDRPLPIERNQTISQPYTVAY